MHILVAKLQNDDFTSILSPARKDCCAFMKGIVMLFRQES